MIKKLCLVLLLLSSNLFAETKAVIFDFGGVLIGKPGQEVVLSSPGKIEGISDPAGVPYSQVIGTILNSLIKETITINKEMYGIVNELKQEKMTVGMLSNIESPVAAFVRTLGLYKEFDPLLLSYEIGIEKPDPRAYALLLSKLDLHPEEVVFIDDRPENVKAALELGIDAIEFKSAGQIRQELIARGMLGKVSRAVLSYDSYLGQGNLAEAFAVGVAEGKTHMLVVWDTYDYEASYPFIVYVSEGERIEEVIQAHSVAGYYRVSKVYDLSKSFEEQ